MALYRSVATLIKNRLEATPFEIRRRRKRYETFLEAVIDLRTTLQRSGDHPCVARFILNLLEMKQLSCAQIAQDYFALAVAHNKPNGYFVEFGAADGVNYCNTYLLEKQFGWTGIIAEPNRSFLPHIKGNRNCVAEENCVWSRSGETLPFTATEDGSLSTLSAFSSEDHHDRSRAETYNVQTISLLDLLVKHNSPEVIDYVSIDTEGSELDIISAFDFRRFTFRCMTIEHNFVSKKRDAVAAILTQNGYLRVLEDVSQFDDWFVHTSAV